jgi:hypothetical protein
MSSRFYAVPKKPIPETLVIPHTAGFFSCCSVTLDRIVQFFNKYRQLPKKVDISGQLNWYNPGTGSIREHYFQESESTWRYRGPVAYEHWYQYTNYKALDFSRIRPFLQKYFSPSKDIQTLVAILETKYCIDYSNTCVLFYRGNDKITETANAPYSDYIDRAKRIQAVNPNVRFLIQSDETEFIDTMMGTFFSAAFFFNDEIRHIKKSLTTVDKVWSKEDNFKFSQWYLAITMVMSKAKHVVCGSGNCSIWICLYRGHTDGVQQFLKTAWQD